MTANYTMLPPPPGLADSEWELRKGRVHVDGDEVTMTSTIRPKGHGKKQRRPGRRLIWASVALLAALAGVAFYVSYAAQFGFVFAIKRFSPAAAAEALIPDAGMLICAMLALAMAVQGRSAKTARVAVVGFAALSAAMNYEAANSYSAHAITVYVMPAVAFAVCTDLVVSVVRRFYYGIEDAASPWITVGRFCGAVVRAAGLVLLYGLRLMLDRKETWRGLRRMVLNAAPLPAEPAAPLPAGQGGAEGSKKARLIAAYRADPRHGDRAQASKAAADLAPGADLQAGTARTYINEYLASLDGQAALWAGSSSSSWSCSYGPGMRSAPPSPSAAWPPCSSWW